jgi:hypothetical protein
MSTIGKRAEDRWSSTEESRLTSGMVKVYFVVQSVVDDAT